MDAKEQEEFESRLEHDPALQKELEIQRAVIRAVENEGLKTEFGRSLKKNTLRRKWKIGMLILLACLIALIIYFYKNSLFPGPSNPGQPQTISARFIQPPLPEADLPFTIYNLDAAAGDTLIHTTG